MPIDLRGLLALQVLQDEPLNPLTVGFISAAEVKAAIASSAARTPLS